MSSEDVLVSISCTTYNQKGYIDKCLEGFIKQKCDFKFEILIHDDASTDGTIEVINEFQRKYPKLIKPIIQKENQWSKGVRGMNAKYNFSRASGKYIALCEGDDYWTDPLKLQKQVDFLEQNKDFAFCAHHVNLVNQFDEVIKQAPNDLENQFFTSRESLHQYFPTLSLLFKTKYVKDKFKPLNVFNGDIYLMAFLSSFGKAAILDFNGGSYRKHEGGIHSNLEYWSKQINSIKTRRVMINSGIFNKKQIKELKKQIRIRKWKAIKNTLKNGVFKSFFGVLKA